RRGRRDARRARALDPARRGSGTVSVRWRIAGALGAALVLWLGAPHLLRGVGFFRVRQIELVGLRYLAPGAVMDALHLAPTASVFDDTERLITRVREMPGIADARVTRRLPGVLRVVVREVEPVALVARGGAEQRTLVAVDGGGRVLPYDPSRVALDLPIAASADSALVGVLALVRSVDPTLFEEITSARAGRSTVVLQLGSRRVLMARDAGPEIIRAVVQVAQDLAARARPYAELDARYAGQIVVRRSTGGST
ncbi:MAG: cell division protein FtsQ/DivIB, partial [Gemmatimonadales bacterium]